MVLPQVYPQIRLPVYAVLAFSLSVVDVALILGPGNPPTLAVLAVRWFADPDTRSGLPGRGRGDAAAGRGGGAASRCGRIGERVLRRWALARLQRGVRAAAQRAGSAARPRGGAALLAAALASMLAWRCGRLPRRWRFPMRCRTAWTLANWRRQAGSLALPALTTLVVGGAPRR